MVAVNHYLVAEKGMKAYATQTMPKAATSQITHISPIFHLVVVPTFLNE